MVVTPGPQLFLRASRSVGFRIPLPLERSTSPIWLPCWSYQCPPSDGRSALVGIFDLL